MEAIIGNIEAMIAMYAPMVLTYIIQLVDWVVLWRKLKSINVKESEHVNRKSIRLMSKNKQLVQDNAELRKLNKEILEQLTKVKQED